MFQVVLQELEQIVCTFAFVMCHVKAALISNNATTVGTLELWDTVDDLLLSLHASRGQHIYLLTELQICDWILLRQSYCSAATFSIRYERFQSAGRLAQPVKDFKRYPNPRCCSTFGSKVMVSQISPKYHLPRQINK